MKSFTIICQHSFHAFNHSPTHLFYSFIDTHISASLADRITTPNTATGDGGNGINIRGIAGRRSNEQGIAIKGTGPTVKELFPEKFGNSGKELFAEKIEGRGRRRQKAEDSFY